MPFDPNDSIDILYIVTRRGPHFFFDPVLIKGQIPASTSRLSSSGSAATCNGISARVLSCWRWVKRGYTPTEWPRVKNHSSYLASWEPKKRTSGQGKLDLQCKGEWWLSAVARKQDSRGPTNSHAPVHAFGRRQEPGKWAACLQEEISLDWTDTGGCLGRGCPLREVGCIV